MFRQMGNNTDPHIRLEYLKMCIRTVSEKLQAERKRYEKSEEESLNEEIELICDALASPCLKPEDKNGLVDYLEELREKGGVDRRKREKTS